MRTRATKTRVRAKAREVDCWEMEARLEAKKSLDTAGGVEREELHILGV